MTRPAVFGVLLLAAVAGAGAAGTAWYVRPVGWARVVGVDYRAVVRRATCRTTWRALFCTTLPRRRDAAARADYTMLELDPLTRRVRSVYRARTFGDSLRWQAVVDSTRRALDRRVLDARGGAVRPCDTAALHFPVAAAWRVGAEEARLYAGWIRPRRRGRALTPRVPYGYVGVWLVPPSWGGCGRDVPVVQDRLLTPAEVVARVTGWVADRTGF
ncbi:hypothetical protein tb265_49580 [Gemmatimonadetes bacterium T265]|nr:hypothetical protein tb265_49580 [Gemmatimonadetes bacterium T265]